MKLALSHRQIVATCFGLSALFIGSIWAITLFVANPPNVSALDNLSFFLSSENENQLFFIALAVSLFVCVALLVAYLSPAIHLKAGALFLLLIAFVHTITAFWFFIWPIGLFSLIGACYGFLVWRQA
jgi:hypothetical protein